MSTRAIVWIVLGVAAAVAAALGIPFILRKMSDAALLSKCGALEAQLAQLRTQGGDPAAAERVQVELLRCAEAAKARGLDIDPEKIAEESCDTLHAQIVSEWAHYRSTSDSDPVKRENTRGTILRNGETMIGCLRKSIETATTRVALEALIAKLEDFILASRDRYSCYKEDKPGCGRYGVNEPHGNDKAAAERARILYPLRQLLQLAKSRLWEIAPETRPAARTSNTVAGQTGTVGTAPRRAS